MPMKAKLNFLAAGVFLAAVNTGWSQPVTFTQKTNGDTARLACALVGRNRGGRGEGESGDQAAMNTARDDVLFGLAIMDQWC
jgi:hypothetical protein